MSITRAKGGKKRLVSDINVTPLVDVMLVLLIIFMITAPMMTQGINIGLHETTNAAQEQKDDPLVITIKQDGKITLKKPNMSGATEVSRDQLIQELTGMPQEDKDQAIFIGADPGAPYGLVATLFADARSAGFLKLTPTINR